MIGASPVVRGCGSRKAGGVYAELGLSPDGRGTPISDFLIDPPVGIGSLPNVSPIGVSFVERDGVTHVIDWIGSTHYPNVADFVEEVARFGLSRRLPKSMDYSVLGPESRLICVHARAIVSAPTFHPTSTEIPIWCPKDRFDHATCESDDACLGRNWSVVEGGVPDPVPDTGVTQIGWGKGVRTLYPDSGFGDRVVRRALPSFAYHAIAPPPDVEVEYEAGVFASFPIGRLAVVEAPDGSHERTTQSVSHADLPVEIVEE